MHGEPLPMDVDVAGVNGGNGRNNSKNHSSQSCIGGDLPSMMKK